MSDFTIRTADEVVFVRTTRIEGGHWTRRERGIVLAVNCENSENIPTEIVVRLSGDEVLRVDPADIRSLTPLLNAAGRCPACGGETDDYDGLWSSSRHCLPCRILKKELSRAPWVSRLLLAPLTAEPTEEVYIGSTSTDITKSNPIF